MKKTIFAFTFLFFNSFLFTQSWLDSFKDVKSKLPDSVRGRVDEALASENVRKSLDETLDSVNFALEDITPEDEYYIGRAIAARILAKYNVYESFEAQSYLNKIVHSLTVFSERPVLFKDYSVVILDSNEINAFATCGGHIMITKGLINCADSEDSLASVLAHEVGHILLKHSVNAIKSSRFGKALSKAGGTAVLVADGDEEKSLKNAYEISAEIDNYVNEMIETGYSKQQEFSADTKALELLYGAGYNPHAIDSMLNALKNKSSVKDKSGFGKTHPTPALRLKNVYMRYKFYPKVESFKKSLERERRFQEFKRKM